MQPPAPIQTLNGSEKDHLLPPTGRKVALREEDKHPYAEYGTGAVGLDQDGVRARKPLDDGAERRKKAGAWQSLDVYQSLANVARHPSLAHEVGSGEPPEREKDRMAMGNGVCRVA